MAKQRRLVTFDWALKRLLRSKANFAVLEGFLSELLHDDIQIEEILESEGNKESEPDKFNRVDMLVKDHLGRRIIIELQYTREDDYFQRMLYGTSKILVESLGQGDKYKDIARVLSVNIIHFDLGQGEDYLYEGRTEFRGVHRHDRLGLTEAQKKLFQTETVENIFPEYYILKVNNFNDVARDGLDEWIYFLKNGKVQPDFDARGLKEAQEAMDEMQLSDAEKSAYENFIKLQRINMGVAESTILMAEEAEARACKAEARADEVEARADEVERRLATAKMEAERQKLEAEKQKEALESRLDQALHALVKSGMTQEQAQKMLGTSQDNV